MTKAKMIRAMQYKELLLHNITSTLKDQLGRDDPETAKARAAWYEVYALLLNCDIKPLRKTRVSRR